MKKLYELLEKINSVQTKQEMEYWAEQIVQLNVLKKNSDIVSNRKLLVKNFLCEFIYNKEKTLLKVDNKQNYPSLNKILKNNLYNAERITALLKRFPEINRNIGSIPSVFLEKIPSDNKKTIVLKIYEHLAQYALKFNLFYEQEFNSEKEKFLDEAELDTTDFEEELSAIVNHPVKLTYLGCGFNGNGFRLDIGDKSFFYKVFYLYNSDDNMRFLNHGVFAEPQMALFATHNARKDKFAKFFFGRVAGAHYCDSFLISEYLEANPSHVEQSRLRLDYISISVNEQLKFDNSINGKIVDFGGIREVIPEFRNKKIRRTVRIILNCIRYKYNAHKLASSWIIKKNNIDVLKRYIQNIDKKTYFESIDLIQKYKIDFPEKLAEILKNIHAIDDTVNLTNIVKSEDILTESVEDLIANTEHHSIKIKTRIMPIPEFNCPGHIIIDLFNNIQGIMFFNSQNEIYKIRFEKLIDSEFQTINELSKDEFNNYKDRYLYTLLYNE